MKKPLVIISPVRNEERFIKHTIEYVFRQSVCPAAWIILNDGSTDKTREILNSYWESVDWIMVVDKRDRGFTQVGKGVIEAFNLGLNTLTESDWEYLVKLDCDVSLKECS